MIDIYITPLIYLVTLIGLITHAHRSHPEFVERRGRSYCLIAARLGVPFLILHLAFTQFEIDPLLGYGILGFLILSSFGLSSYGYLGAFFVVAAYVFYQWTFWFPDRESFILRNRTRTSTPKGSSPLVGEQGRSTTPLRPCGKVIVGEREYEATCESGFLEASQTIEVVAESSFGLTVRAR